ncbi:hypothetical protein K503DRAFT_782441 [Rhizopogon vinicolor AM-OR11-026]|uniref:Uncharacterized protein n=1 Tax=Rhizopogon vinicolor AM-OR11-026 TaxID=1314800 RepID=A0A1B7N2F8_9AGAM|nr:hypothetical protein K503DRAFT_782441 [Rhizopogon vinicolor AM-OR11-026]
MSTTINSETLLSGTLGITSSSSASSDATPTTSTSPLISTVAAGQVITDLTSQTTSYLTSQDAITSESTITISVNTISTNTISTNTSSSNTTTSPSNAGDIVSGVMGGIVAICVLGILLFCIRRHRRRDRVVSHPSAGWKLPQVGRKVGYIVTPFPHPERDGGMRQYRDNLHLPAGTQPAGTDGGFNHEKSHLRLPLQSSDPSLSNNQQNSVSLSGEGYQSPLRTGQRQHPQAPSINAMPQADWHRQRPPSPSGHVMKEREVVGHQGFEFAMQQEVHGDGSVMVKHQNAGRVPSEGGSILLSDIPPAYESIVQ